MSVMAHRVLIIDDEVSLARNIKDYLEVDGFDAEVCWDGEAGLAAFTDLPADVVVLDLTLPGMGGLDVLAHLHERAPWTKVIIITAHGDGQTGAMVLQAGAFEYLAKPLALSELRRVVGRAVAEAVEHGLRRPDH